MANNTSNSEHLVPAASPALENLKQQVVAEVGIAGRKVNPAQYNQALDQVKYEVATEIGVPLQQGYNGNLTAKQTGSIGGHMGGHIGGQMVKRLISLAESHLTGQ
ncbi:MAG: small, acid-soluble spore protein, alpha/beta type [Symbiobacteriia bacterium]